MKVLEMGGYMLRYSYRPFKCIFPGLGTWMHMNGWGIKELAAHTGIAYQTIRSNLTGKHEFGMYAIDRVLEATGLTYEQAFGRRCKLE